MKIDLDWIQKELDAGRKVELECVYRTGFLIPSEGYNAISNELILKQEKLIVKEINFGIICLEGDLGDRYSNTILGNEFKYFRIKQAPTFDDLIDVAVKAVKDKVLHSMQIGENKRKGRYVNFSQNGNSANKAHYENDTAPYAVISFINSLYTETFVIECESDTNKLISGAKTVLKNGEVLEFSNNDRGYLWFNFNDYESEIFPFVALKGATVTQKKGNK